MKQMLLILNTIQDKSIKKEVQRGIDSFHGVIARAISLGEKTDDSQLQPGPIQKNLQGLWEEYKTTTDSNEKWQINGIVEKYKQQNPENAEEIQTYWNGLMTGRYNN